MTKNSTTSAPSALEVEGLLDITDKGHGFLLDLQKFPASNKTTDPFVGRELIQKHALQSGLVIKGNAEGKRGHNPNLIEILTLNGQEPDDYLEVTRFDETTVIDPSDRIQLETDSDTFGTRIMDMVTPIGKGQRGLIVAPPRTGKTILLQQIANAISTNHPEMHLIMLLIDERPEEVTDMRRSTQAQVIASSNDKDIETHVRTGTLTLEMAKRRVEYGENVVILLDSITRLARAFNSSMKSSGRTMSGGLDIKGLQFPKRFFGSARMNEGGGSLTILATALIETGSRMDDIIFSEFKGTGNMELVLDRDLANRRVYPAINVTDSGTRKEERLIPEKDLEKINRLRRYLHGLAPGQDIETLRVAMKKHKTNRDFLDQLP
jgi:transcription termination factor Rho